MASIFELLNGINVNEKTEKKNGLTYLSWAWAWAEVKKVVPDATYTIYERQTEYGPVNYFTDGRTCWVKTGVTLNGLEHIEQLPVMDFKNRSIPLESVSSTDINKAIQRSLTKACARHGLGLYIYAGEDLPEDAPQGTKEAAQDAGQKKLEQINQQMEEIKERSPRALATEEQKKIIKEKASDEMYLNAMQAFGPELERMTVGQAVKLIARIEKAAS
jgi:hypothetical protein